MDKLSATIVVPAYNEEAMIGSSIEAVTAYLATIEDRYAWELIVVNDGSTDATGRIIDDYASSDPRVRALHHGVNFNLGQALRYAFNNARGDYVVTLDSDLSYGPEHIGLLLDTIVETNAKIVVASPYAKDGKVTAVPAARKFMSRWANRLLAWTAKGRLSTVTGMVRAYDTEFLRSLDLKAWDFEVNTEIIYKAQLLRAHIVEVPAHLDWTGQRAVGNARVSSIRIRRSVVAQAFTSFLFRPFMFFILPGLVILGFALYTLGWAAYHTFDAWTDPAVDTFSAAVGVAFDTSPHSFVVGGVGLLVAIQLISLGIISMQNKRYFEELFHLGTSVYREQLGLSPRRVESEGMALRPVEPGSHAVGQPEAPEPTADTPDQEAEDSAWKRSG
jgi:glycosyltransferase involved in cell wall biosynthesis